MYHAFVKHKARTHFANLSAGEWHKMTREVADDAHHTFPGDHALGGERHSRAATELWFERLYRLYPELEFEVHDIVCGGWPWATTIAIEWSDQGICADGEPYRNSGTHIIRLRWGKAVYIHAYLDNEELAASLQRMAAADIEEADAKPITG
jgi:ketosteroid isomerase-like protein